MDDRWEAQTPSEGDMPGADAGCLRNEGGKAGDPCKLCDRDMPLTFHHLIPRTVHRNKWFRKTYTRDQMNRGIYVCRDCHAAVHRFIPSAKEMGRQYNTCSALAGHPEVATFLKWISGRSVNKRVRTRSAQNR